MRELFGEDLSTPSTDLVGPRPVCGSQHPVAVVHKFNSTVVVDSDADIPGLLHHGFKALIPFFAVVMRASQGWNQAEAFDADVISVVRIIKGHGIAVSVTEPAEHSGTEPGHHRAPPPGLFEHLIDAKPSPELHHHESVPSPHIDEIGVFDLPPNHIQGRPITKQEQLVGLALQPVTIGRMKCAAVDFAVRAGGWNEQGFRILLTGSFYDSAVDLEGLKFKHAAATDGYDCLGHGGRRGGGMEGAHASRINGCYGRFSVADSSVIAPDAMAAM